MLNNLSSSTNTNNNLSRLQPPMVCLGRPLVGGAAHSRLLKSKSRTNVSNGESSENGGSNSSSESSSSSSNNNKNNDNSSSNDEDRVLAIATSVGAGAGTCTSVAMCHDSTQLESSQTVPARIDIISGRSSPLCDDDDNQQANSTLRNMTTTGITVPCQINIVNSFPAQNTTNCNQGQNHSCAADLSPNFYSNGKN